MIDVRAGSREEFRQAWTPDEVAEFNAKVAEGARKIAEHQEAVFLREFSKPIEVVPPDLGRVIHTVQEIKASDELGRLEENAQRLADEAKAYPVLAEAMATVVAFREHFRHGDDAEQKTPGLFDPRKHCAICSGTGCKCDSCRGRYFVGAPGCVALRPSGSPQYETRVLE